MRILLVHLLLAAASVAGFSPSPSTAIRRGTTALGVAGGYRNNNGPNKQPTIAAQDDKEYWAGMPLHRRKEHSTKPVSDRAVTANDRRKIEDVMIREDYWLTWAMAMLGPLIIWYHPSYMTDGSPSLIGVAGGLFHILFAALLWVQTRRVRMVFDRTGFEFYNIKGPGLDLDKGAWLERKPDNYVAGTQNRWSYDSVTNYGFFPSLDFPVICYFKETETPEWKWNRWFAAFDSYQRGQPHFFPGICNAREVKAEFEKRGVKRKPLPTFLPKE